MYDGIKKKKTMTKFLIVTGPEHSGKTTTMGMIYKKLLLSAKDPYLADVNENRIPVNDSLMDNGIPKDFIAHLNIKGKKVAMISAGDIAQYVKEYVEDYLDKQFDYIICCIRTVNRKGSARRVLYSDFASYPKEEFWTVYSDDKEQMFNVKKNIVNQIVSKIV